MRVLTNLPREHDPAGEVGHEDAPPAKSESPRRFLRNSRPSATTITVRELAFAKKNGTPEYMAPEHATFPKTRGECADGARPCPWARCRFHLVLDVAKNGSLKLNFPEIAEEGNFDALEDTCALDVADRGPLTLDEVAFKTNVVRERVRQIEDRASRALRRLPLARSFRE